MEAERQIKQNENKYMLAQNEILRLLSRSLVLFIFYQMTSFSCLLELEITLVLSLTLAKSNTSAKEKCNLVSDLTCPKWKRGHGRRSKLSRLVNMIILSHSSVPTEQLTFTVVVVIQINSDLSGSFSTGRRAYEFKIVSPL